MQLSKTLVKWYTKLAQRVFPLKLLRWKSAGILLTYRCNAACADCYENSGPKRRAVVPVEDLRQYLRELRKLGMRGRDLHFGGGEPFFDYRHLIAALEVAKEEGMLPLGKLETNGFWCKTEELARQRMQEIASYGVLRLVISADPFHQEFVPVEAVRCAQRVAREILGPDRVRVNQQEYLDAPIDVMRLSEEEKTEVFREMLGKHPWRITGRAAKNLAHMAEKHPAASFRGDHCAWKLLGKGSMHLDPYGNVFPSVCAGIVIGNAKRQPLTQILSEYEYREHPVVSALAEGGPCELLEQAREVGFLEDSAGYASKCHLCYSLREFYSQQSMHPDEIGPPEVYAD